jgi:two-component system chemotaxis response regulator CheY
MAYDFSNLTAYVIDANSFSRQIQRGLLGAVGIRHEAAKEMADAEAALAEMAHFPPDIILTDVDLPGMSGVDFIRAVRHLEDEEKRYTPIIVCTAYTERERVMEYRDAGAHEVLHKPISAQTLYDRLVSVIEAPRSFVYTQVFTGPDRRRRLEGPDGAERRGAKAPQD